jgi:hypothetical protein
MSIPQRLRGSLIFNTITCEFSKPDYSLTPLVSALDDRLPPTITASTLAAQVADFLETPDLRIIIRQKDAPAALDGSEELLEEEPSQHHQRSLLCESLVLFGVC